MKLEPLAHDYFSGAVPTGNFFQMKLTELETMCSNCPDSPGINFQFELILIGLLSYFEAFCKDHFASLINIEPHLIETLKAHGQDTLIDSTNIMLYQEDILVRIGFLIAEKYDFGTSKKINALYKALLNITPFSKDDIIMLDKMLRDRNLIVHHGGVYTLSHLKQKDAPLEKLKVDAFFNSIVFTKIELRERIDFIASITQKIMNSSHDALLKYLENHNIRPSKERQKAIDWLIYWED